MEAPRTFLSPGSEFNLQPDEAKLACGCYAVKVEAGWRITGSAFLCPRRHRLQEVVRV